MEIFKNIDPKYLSSKATRFSAAAALALATVFTSSPARAGEGVDLTPPEGSVTPQAFGHLEVEISNGLYGRTNFLVRSGELHGLVPGAGYGVWACLETRYDCSTNAYPEIITDETGSASFVDLKFYGIERGGHRFTTWQVRQNTEGEIPDNACPVGDTPCLEGPLSLH